MTAFGLSGLASVVASCPLLGVERTLSGRWPCRLMTLAL